MILRRLTKHVRTQNWFAVALDFIIVVVGVFIGIQVSNWNASRVEQSQARDLLNRMVSEALEVQNDLRDYTDVQNFILERNTTLALRLQDQPACLAMDDELKIMLWSIGDFPPPRFSLSTAVQALNTGQLMLIRDPAIRDGVQSITDEMTFLNRQWQRYIRTKQSTEQVVVQAAGLVITRAADSIVSINEDTDPDRYSVLTPEKICAATDVIALVSNVEATQEIYVSYLSQVQASLDAYVVMLNGHSDYRSSKAAQ